MKKYKKLGGGQGFIDDYYYYGITPEWLDGLIGAIILLAYFTFPWWMELI